MTMEGDARSLIQDELDRMIANLKGVQGYEPGVRVIAAMSGGIDSSVMAALLHMAGFQVVGVSMKLFDKGGEGSRADSAGRCCTLDDFQDARRVAHRMGFDHYVMDFGERFRRDVMDPFLVSYLAGETPSPCILCNKHLKFDALFRTTDELEARFVATGHYAKIHLDEQGFHLRKASDLSKDQSYFLFPHTQSTLARTLFPLESIPKSTVRGMARHLKLGLEEKPESQEICFVPDDRYDRFIEASGKAPRLEAGPIRHVADGAILGQHQGYWRFTIGQRKGLGVAFSHPLYVIRTDPGTNTVWVGEDDLLLGSELIAREVSWCLGPPDRSITCSARLRSRSAEVPATLELLAPARVRVLFESPQRAITPGQAVVFYQGDEVLGGGWIERIG